MSVTDVAARISQLQAHFALLAPRTTGTASPLLGQPAVSSFADALADSGRTGAVAGGAGTLAAGAGPAAATTPGSPATASSGTGGVTGQAVVAEARKYLGVPYVWGGTDPSNGLDCSGLVQLVYDKLGIDLPRVSYQQATAGRPVAGLADARPGDILAFGSPVHHVGIYIGDNKMIEAPRPGLDVRVSEVYETPSAIRRVLPESASRALPGGTPYTRLFESASERYGVDATLLAAVAKQESAFDPTAVSHAGARGLMQLMPATAAGLGVADPFDPAQAVDGGARLLRDLLREFDRVDLALAAYNAGPGAVHRYGGIPPYPETQNYVRAVLGHQSAMEAR